MAADQVHRAPSIEKQERDAFEAWARAHSRLFAGPYGVSPISRFINYGRVSRDHEGRYEVPQLQQLWECWQAGGRYVGEGMF